jgi:hypothetical protein
MDNWTQEELKIAGKKYGEALMQYNFRLYIDPDLKTQVISLIPQHMPLYDQLLTSKGERSIADNSFSNDIGETFAKISKSPNSWGLKRAGHDLFHFCLIRCMNEFDDAEIVFD